MEKWSKKEILGHLIDSCMINYQRFIEAQFEENPHISMIKTNIVKQLYINFISQQLIDL